MSSVVVANVVVIVVAIVVALFPADYNDNNRSDDRGSGQNSTYLVVQGRAVG